MKVAIKQAGGWRVIKARIGTADVYLWIRPDGTKAESQPDFNAIGANVWGLLPGDAVEVDDSELADNLRQADTSAADDSDAPLTGEWLAGVSGGEASLPPASSEPLWRLTWDVLTDGHVEVSLEFDDPWEQRCNAVRELDVRTRGEFRSLRRMLRVSE